MDQLNIFDLMYEDYKITKPIRLIELFGGVGSQAMALRNIGANFEHYKLVEFDKYPVASYNAIHGTNFETTDITKVNAKDLEIVDTDKFEYIMTYSFPCQDLSNAGSKKGMKKGDNTRSGLLWEVERILYECNELPQVLLMENVPDVIGIKNIGDFNLWQESLEKLGYSNYVSNMNAKDFGIPQTRKRSFMISVLGPYNYNFPKKIKLEKKLKDLLEEEVDKKYYISQKMKDYLSGINQKDSKYNRREVFERNLDEKKEVASTITTRSGSRATDNFIIVPEKTKKGFTNAYEGDGVYINRPHQKRGVVQKDMIQTLTTKPGLVGVVIKSYENLIIRKLTPLECWRLMGFTDEDFHKAVEVNSNAQLYKQAGNSIVVQVLEQIFKRLL